MREWRSEIGHDDDDDEGFSIYFRLFGANPTCDGATWTPAEFRPLILRAIFFVKAQ
ncbi:hypothetical protein ISN45_At02g025560 [Arabidopsis thaliana x Arabidopsis arenosa]|uniref:Uncharacterized protein n=2 Tax=Arabidopsis TaxID=3701 RepID=A0A8T2G763_ARASU|nr:hypothetical protein ISN45_At02g025560 [Arabidopsis thaliana x Arabidopsis arenosa]KAG7642700.1 hypothetical protein ISN44_As02g025890 [Arabidopsis suecica]